MRYEVIELVDAVEGDEVYAGGEWVAVERVHVFGSRGDLVKIFFAGGGTQAAPLHHFGKARRPVVEVADAIAAYAADEAAKAPEATPELVEAVRAVVHPRAARPAPVVDEPYVDYSCSYCERTATLVGAGSDGDFYCADHAYLAPGRTEEIRP